MQRDVGGSEAGTGKDEGQPAYYPGTVSARQTTKSHDSRLNLFDFSFLNHSSSTENGLLHPAHHFLHRTDTVLFNNVTKP